MLSPIIKGLFRAERKLQENSRVGESEFEREFSWTWAVVLGLLLLAGAGIKYWIF